MREIFERYINWTKIKVRIHVSDKKLPFAHEREIWWASIGENIGYEQNGKHELYERPVLVLKRFNSSVFWGLPITSKRKENKYYFSIKYNNKDYSIILSQLKLMSTKRLRRKIRTIKKEEFEEIRVAVKSLI